MHEIAVLKVARSILSGRLGGLARVACFTVLLFSVCRGAMAQDVDALDQLNLAFREAHAKARAAVLKRSDPVIIVDLDTLFLIRNGQRTEAKVLPPLYHRLKAVAHGPLTVHLTLSQHGAGPYDDDKIADIRAIRNITKTAIDAVSDKFFSVQQLDRQREILQTTLAFLDQVLEAKACSANDLTAFARKVQPGIMENAEDAARLQLDAYDAKLAEWREQMTAKEWQRLKVVVMGSALPRKDNLSTQFFAKVLDEAGEGKRIIYAEALFDEAKALRLLAALQVDAVMAARFFGEASMLHRDLLADAAARYLKENGERLKTLKAGAK
jgi:hypothetical protein